MGFTVEAAKSRVLAIKAGKNNKTPVFVALDELLAKKDKDRIKDLKENVGRALTPAQSKPIEEAKTVEDLAAVLDGMVDERGSPKKQIAPLGSPILQPTGERRRTGSHYTPRSLTAPIVKYALEPAFDRLGPNATPEQVLELKVCDPAMGSGAFLVEACRALGERLVAAWTRWPETRPTIPADEDEELHARRLVAQRCLYGVDKNPRAVDLARLSLWLATLARDHEFTFLDHALKCGDSLVGLTTAQIAATHWDASKPPTFVGKLVGDHLREAEGGRARIRSAADNATEAELRPQLRAVDVKLDVARRIGDEIVAAFFQADKTNKRIEHLVEFQKSVQSNLGSSRWADAATKFSDPLSRGEYPLTPFHWPVEFPEVFARENGGFDAIIGNPPYIAGRNISGMLGDSYLSWLIMSAGINPGQADLSAHFVHHARLLSGKRGSVGFVTTNTVAQGDSALVGLEQAIKSGSTIYFARRSMIWPGDAAVHVSEFSLSNDKINKKSILDGVEVEFITHFLQSGNFERIMLHANRGIASKGYDVGGNGFLLGNDEYLKFIACHPEEKDIFLPHINGKELYSKPMATPDRYIINFFDWSLDKAAQYPAALNRIKEMVKPYRDSVKRKSTREQWWIFNENRPGLRRISSKSRSCNCQGANQ